MTCDGSGDDGSLERPSTGPAPAELTGGGALAALSVCESLLISLVERNVLDAAELAEVLESARDANLQAEAGRFSRGEHEVAAALIRQLLLRCQTARPDKQ